MRKDTKAGSEGPQAGSFDELMHGRELLGELAARPAADDPATWLQRVRSAAQELFVAVEKHTESTEAEGGTLANVTVRKPYLMYARQRLEHEHDDMLHRLSEIDVETERQIAAQDYNIELVRLQVRVVREILLLHLARTQALLFEAYVRVEGGPAS
ncbi:MAG: hypothetical protein M0R74_01990 [Dehalococcoidia bacterium]|nr:hypothetical protein [Dehalococcoidia bacterium]